MFSRFGYNWIDMNKILNEAICFQYYDDPKRIVVTVNSGTIVLTGGAAKKFLNCVPMEDQDEFLEEFLKSP